MPTVELPFPTSLSPSRASDFMTCPLLFRLKSIDRLPDPPSAATVRGSLVHRALETLFDLPAPERSAAAADHLATRAWEELRQTDPASASVFGDTDSAVGTMRRLIDMYFTLEDPGRLEPHARELGVSALLEDSFEIRGFIDRVDLSPGGDVRIVDYKTGRSPGAGFEAKPMFQMRFYGLIWWRMTGTVPRLLQLMYLGSGDVLRYEPDETELRATERKVLAVRDAIARAADLGEFAASPSRLCDWCAHRDLCPAWGGAPPPLPPRGDWPTSSLRAGPEDTP